eukprot:267587_1
MAMIFYIAAMINILLIRTCIAVIIILKFEYTHIHLSFASDNTFHWILVYFSLLIINLFCARVWFFFYDWKRNEDLLTLKWSNKLLLTTTEHKTDPNRPWTIRCENTLGTTKFVVYIIMIDYIIFVLGLLYFASNFGLNSTTTSVYTKCIGLLPTSVLLLYLFIQCFRRNDAIGIRKELIHYLIIILFTAVPFALSYVLLNHGVLRQLVLDSLVSVMTVATIIRMFRVPQLLTFTEDNDNYTKTGSFISSFALNVVHRSPDDITFVEIFQSETAIKAFSNHCVSEYSVDNLLFLIEYHQIKYILGHFVTENKADDRNMKINVAKKQKLNAVIMDPGVSTPLSHAYDMIVTGPSIEYDNKWIIPFPQTLLTQNGVLEMDKTHYLMHCKMWKYLYKTYIAKKSRSSIHIAPDSDVRYRILLCFETYVVELEANIINYRSKEIAEQYEMMNQTFMDLFDAAAKEIFWLLRKDSWVRFKSKPEYEALKKQMKGR